MRPGTDFFLRHIGDHFPFNSAPPVIQQMPAVQQQPLTVSCPVCFEPVAGARFAPHLEKCMNGGKRVERRKASHALLDDNKIPSKQKVEAVDMHPSSLIIRIKLQNGGTSMCLFHNLFHIRPIGYRFS